MAFVIVSGLQRTALFFISLFGVGEGGGAEPYRGRETVHAHASWNTGLPGPAQGTPQAEDCVCLARSKPGGTRTRTGRRLAQPVSGKAAATGRPTERSPSRRAVSVKKRRKSILTFKYRSKVVNPKSECN